ARATRSDRGRADQRYLYRSQTANAVHPAIQRERAVGVCERLPARSWIRWLEGNEAASGDHVEPAGLQPRGECVYCAVRYGTLDAEERCRRHSTGAVDFELRLQLFPTQRYQALQPRAAVPECLHVWQVE